MEAEPVLAVAAATGGICMALSPLLQLRRVLERGSSDDISIPFLLIVAVGATVWFAYGIAMPNAALIVSNAVAVATNLATIATVRRFRRRARSFELG